MKKFTVLCDFNGQKSPFAFYIGEPEPSHHPIAAQSDWLSKNRGGSVPQDVSEAIQKIYNLAKENNVDFEELCFYAMSNAANNDSDANTNQAN